MDETKIDDTRRYTVQELTPEIPDDFNCSMDNKKRQLFVSGTSGEMYMTYGFNLVYVYLREYQDRYSSCDSFIVVVAREKLMMELKQSVPVGYSDYEVKFQPCPKNLHFFQVKGEQGIIKKYFHYADGELRFKRKLDFNRKWTVAYCLWKCGYYYVYGGYGANDYLIRSK